MTVMIDLSHPLEHGMITYQGIPGPVIEDFLGREESRSRYEPGTEFQIGTIRMAANTGTYIDSPFHRYADGQDLSGLELGAIANLDGITFRVAAESRAIDPDLFAGHDLAGRAVLIHTGWARHWRTDEYFNGMHPFLTAASAEHLVEAKAALVGIDSYNIDGTEGGARPVHTALLAAGIPIVEHMRRLEDLPDSGYRFFAVPPPIVGMGSFPVRAFALID